MIRRSLVAIVLDGHRFDSRQLGNDSARLQPWVKGVRRLCGLHGVCLDLEGRACPAALVRSGLRIHPDEDEHDMNMTKQEVREEYKESDGNPVIKSRIRSLRRAMRRRQSLKAAATATVVVTNPTHYAVALRYETEMPAPVVVAKGQLTARGKNQAAGTRQRNHAGGKQVAQALYRGVEAAVSIPAKPYQAVAEILALVFRAEAEVRRKAEAASGAPGTLLAKR